jgi:hypothetical protein
MLKILSIVFLIILIIGGVLFVRSWNSTTPWGAGTGTIAPEKIKSG